MVEDTLKSHATDERFSRQVIDSLLARPRLLEIEGHPVRQLWEAIRAALPEYEVITGDEVADKQHLEAVEENMDWTYHVDDRTALRTQMTVTTFRAIRGRTAPVRLLAAGRVFRPGPEDATHLNVFHQVDGICVEPGADVTALRATVERVIRSAVGEAELRWTEHDYGFVANGLEVAFKADDAWHDLSGSGTLKPETLRDAGFDPDQVSGFAFGLGLERLAMIRNGVDDIRALWQPPHVPG